MTGLRNKNSRGDRLCAQRKNKTKNKQKETRNSRDKRNEQNDETFNQRENFTGQQLKQNTQFSDHLMFKQARPFEKCPSIIYKPQNMSDLHKK